MDNKWSIEGELPIGFGMFLAANAKSMQTFANMNELEKQEVVEKSRNMKTKQDMENFVNSLGKNSREKES